jgi:hypothetical protein
MKRLILFANRYFLLMAYNTAQFFSTPTAAEKKMLGQNENAREEPRALTINYETNFV